MLIDAVRGALAGSLPDGGHLVDLYGGVGLFAGTVEADKVTVVESASSSVADARVNLADRDVRILKVDVGRWHPARADAVVADPPRTGLAAAGVAAVVATQRSGGPREL